MTDTGHGVTIQEAHGITGLSVRTLRRYVKTGKLTVERAPCKFGQQILFSEAELRPIAVSAGGETPGQVAGVPRGGDSPGDSEPVTENPLMAKLEGATFRIGWLEGQLDMTRKALTEGEEARQQREAELLKEKAAVLDLDRSLREERQRRQAAEKEKSALEARLRDFERPWWKRLFRPTSAAAVL